MLTKKIIFVSEFTPKSINLERNHRSYQIYSDLIDLVGENNVITQHSYSYVESIKRINHTRVAYCVIDDDINSNIIRYNKKFDIPTIICLKKITALDTQFTIENSVYWTDVLYTDFMQELRLLSECWERLCISKVEAGLLGGLGIPSKYYAYNPVGLIRKHLDRIREIRKKEAKEKGLLLLVGDMTKVATKMRIEWFMKNAQAQGLPSDARVVMIGLGSDEIEKEVGKVVGVEVVGWLEEDELEKMLIRTAGILAPQRTNLGNLTWIVDMAYAGIPMAVSRFANYILDIPPGVISVEDDWNAWNQVMENIITSNGKGKIEVNEGWFSRNTNPFKEVINI